MNTNKIIAFIMLLNFITSILIGSAHYRTTGQSVEAIIALFLVMFTMSLPCLVLRLQASENHKRTKNNGK